MADPANKKPVIAQIRRNGHMFWVRDIRELEPGVFVGLVANEGVPFHAFGSLIAFVDQEKNTEVVDIKVGHISMFDHRQDRPN